MTLLYLSGKDLLRSLRSAFLLVMMFVVPLGLTALMYLAFGGLGGGGEPGLARTTVLVINADGGIYGVNAGQVLLDALRTEGLAELLDVREAMDADAARLAVDQGEAGVALVVPPGFTASALGLAGGAEVLVYHDPTLSVGPGIVRGVASGVVDRFSGATIAVRTAQTQLGDRGLNLTPEELTALGNRYVDAIAGRLGVGEGAAGGAPYAVVEPRAEEQPTEQSSGLLAMIGPIFAGQMLFAAFFAAAYSVESILREEEEGTLARLFTTPVPRDAVLGAKFLSAGLLVLGQTVTLMAVTGAAVRLDWGNPLALALLELGLVVAAAGLGTFLLSLVRSTRASGAVIGGGLTVTSMLGGVVTASVPNLPPALQTLSLAFPQGWAMRGWLVALDGGGPGDVLLSVAVMALYGGALFAVGAWRFRRRFS